MALSFKFAYPLTQFGFFSTLITNTIFIYLTIFYIKKIPDTYKSMVLVFSSTGIMFSAWEIIARPFAHSYNKGLVYFSLNDWLYEFPEFLQFAIILYASFYLVILAIIAIQFVFRYFTLCRPHLARKFGGVGVSVWISYSLVSGAIYGGSLYLFCPPDSYSDSYMREVLSDSYNLKIAEVTRFLIIPYAENGSVRWNNLSFLLVGVMILSLQYVIIVYCGVRMHTILQKELSQQSLVNRKLQKQFFRALVVQTIVPTLLFVLPIAPFLIGPLVVPFLGIEMNFQTGWMYVILCLYPPLDTIAFMLIVSEYKKVALNVVKPILPKRIKISSEISQSTGPAFTK